MIHLIDNFDSFTYNIVHAFHMLGVGSEVFRNTAPLDQVFEKKPSFLVIGPGPGNPAHAGISKACIQKADVQSIPLLGICLGHQALGEVFGSQVVRAKKAIHGKASEIFHYERALFQGVSQGFKAVRYHSLILETAPKGFEIAAWTHDNEIMAIAHTQKPLYGLQFHPESIASEEGLKLLQNFLLCKKPDFL